MILLLLSLSILIITFLGCGGGSSDGSGGSGSGDFVKLSIDSGAENTYTEAFSPTIVCDPRVDWAFSQIILYDNYLGSDQWGMIFDIMFISDAVGTYDVTVPGDGLNVSFIDGSGTYQANFAAVGSSGTVTVTRSDTRIEGTFTINAVDAGSNTITLSGSFGVDSGVSLSCP
jgi:hypothetical protein